MAGTLDERLDASIEALKSLIAERVRAEQRVDRLTGLPNGVALAEKIQASIDADRPLWAAFVEVDRFKTVNDRFGYENADDLLVRVGEQLRVGTQSFFGGRAVAYRSHGDEFYILGDDVVHGDGAGWTPHDALELIRKTIGAIRVPVAEIGEMTCTVSVGWLASHDVPRPIRQRAIMDCVERAVAEAKRSRDTVVRYSAELTNSPSITLRGDCTACGCKLSMDVKRDANKATDAMHCPNCGASVDRPPPPVVRKPEPVQRV